MSTPEVLTTRFVYILVVIVPLIPGYPNVLSKYSSVNLMTSLALQRGIPYRNKQT